MGWASVHIADLKAGKTVRFTAYGRSMTGKIEHGWAVTVEPIRDPAELKVGDIVLCEVSGAQYLHLIKDIGPGRGRFQIGNNKGHINGWTTPTRIYGRCVQVDDGEE